MALASTVLSMENSCMKLVKFPVASMVSAHPFSFSQAIPAWTNMRTRSTAGKPFSAKPYLSTVPCLTARKLSVSKVSHSDLTTILSLAYHWREIQGLNNWENLIQPLHPLLQSEIIRYGKFVTACCDAFNLNPGSTRYLNCKYGKKSILREVGLGDSGYQVTKYIYATPDINIPIQNGDPCGRWVGYIAVSSDDETKRLGRRDILVTFRGAVTNAEWIANLMSVLAPARLDPNIPRPDVKVEAGFLTLYTSNESDTRFGLGSCREQLLSELSRILRKYENEEMSITLAGHSMGSSLALLFAYDIAELGLNRDNHSNKVKIPLTVFFFAGPRVGNVQFKERCEELGVKVLRIVNASDPITKLPGVVFNETFRVLGGKYEFPWSCDCYAHVGIELLLDFLKMEDDDEVHQISEITESAGKGLMDFLKIGDIFCVHDMETYIGLLKCSNNRPKVERKGVNFFGKLRSLSSIRHNVATPRLGEMPR